MNSLLLNLTDFLFCVGPYYSRGCISLLFCCPYAPKALECILNPLRFLRGGWRNCVSASGR
jgi:hypothetical protein